MKRVANLGRVAASLEAYWSPKVVGRINDHFVKVAKVKGELCWHKHDAEDEMFLILKGRLVIQYADHEVELEEGDVHVVPRNTLHNPVAAEECWLALVEPAGTRHTGDVVSPLTCPIEEQLAGEWP